MPKRKVAPGPPPTRTMIEMAIRGYNARIADLEAERDECMKMLRQIPEEPIKKPSRMWTKAEKEEKADKMRQWHEEQRKAGDVPQAQ